MKWTGEKPTESGWYWCNHQFPHVVYIKQSFYGLEWNEPYEDEDCEGNLTTYDDFFDVADSDCKWAGPLKEPT